MKQRIPWPLKFGMKVLFGAAGISYQRLKRARLVEHGRMEDPGFANEIFNLHVRGVARRHGLPLSGGLLEIGPGDSIATGVLGLAAGFSRVDLVDAGQFADLRPRELARLFSALGASPPSIPVDASADESIHALARVGIHYGTGGVKSLQALAEGSVHISFSNTVLQHVFRAELPALTAALGRAHAPGSWGSHSVNFTDHFSGGFVNHRLPPWLMESALIKRGNLYTNRVSTLEYVKLFEGAGFAIERLNVDFFDPTPVARAEYNCADAFRRGAGSRRILRTIFILRKDQENV